MTIVSCEQFWIDGDGYDRIRVTYDKGISFWKRSISRSFTRTPQKGWVEASVITSTHKGKVTHIFQNEPTPDKHVLKWLDQELKYQIEQNPPTKNSDIIDWGVEDQKASQHFPSVFWRVLSFLLLILFQTILFSASFVLGAILGKLFAWAQVDYWTAAFTILVVVYLRRLEKEKPWYMLQARKKEKAHE